ncbi:MAG: DUF4132 domain-containing protein [Rhodocyclaceae bacterium]|nr:DUF4132 domain-containing protein [Rhodocyclaceae bacterium]
MFGPASPDGVPAAWLEALRVWLAPLQELALEVETYVLSGKSAGVLAVAHQRGAIGIRIGVTGYAQAHSGGDERPSLYAQFAALPISIALRWARFIGACAGTAADSLCLGLAPESSWLEALLEHSVGAPVTAVSPTRIDPPTLSAELIESLLTEQGCDPATLWRAAFTAGPVPVPLPEWGDRSFISLRLQRRRRLVCALPGYADALLRHAPVLRPALCAAAPSERQDVLRILGTVPDATLRLYAPELCELAASGSFKVRSAAAQLLRRCGEHMLPALQNLAAGAARSEQRAHALRLLLNLARESGRADLETGARALAAADPSAAVHGLLHEWDAKDAAHAAGLGGLVCEPPQVDWRGTANPLPPAAMAKFRAAIEIRVERANSRLRRMEAARAGSANSCGALSYEKYCADHVPELLAYLQNDGPPVPRTPADTYVSRTRLPYSEQAIKAIAAQPGVSFPAICKAIVYFGLSQNFKDAPSDLLLQCASLVRLHDPDLSLPELALAMAGLGYGPEAALGYFCDNWSLFEQDGWCADDLWPFFAQHIQLLINELEHGSLLGYGTRRRALFRAAASFPELPPLLVNCLFALALAGGRADAARARTALSAVPDKLPRIMAALDDAKAEARLAAARWLGSLRQVEAIPALLRAAAREKHDAALGAMLDAMEALGEPITSLLDREAYAAQARKALKKGLPAELAFFPWQKLPAVHWASDGAAVAPELLQWMLVQSWRGKSSRPGTLLARYCALMRPREREQLGQIVLQAWIEEDTRTLSAEEAHPLALEQAQMLLAPWNANRAQYAEQLARGLTAEQLAAELLPDYMRREKGDALASAGLLALAAACCGVQAAPTVRRYVQTYFGRRMKQGLALIAMLGAMDHASATHELFSLASGFRIKTFQAAAHKYTQLLAEQHGWNAAEMADRSIPTAGFDATGALLLSYGDRVFTGRLLADFKIEVTNPDGKKIAALPDARQNDDAECVKLAKQALAAARKEIKSIVALQTTRLYEAMCTQRSWRYEDWAEYVLRHPIVRHLAQRLLWVQMDGDDVACIFRPLADGSLTDAGDDAVQLPLDAEIRLAHDTLLDAGQVAAWQQHLADYAIEPLFRQIGRGRYVLPASLAADDEINDFQGHLIETLELRGRAIKRGYAPPEPTWVAWFCTYSKCIESLKLTAYIEFTGSRLPEQSGTVALLSMWFSDSGDANDLKRERLPLAKVAPVALSECYHDLQEIAAGGSGFDPNWGDRTGA